MSDGSGTTGGGRGATAALAIAVALVLGTGVALALVRVGDDGARGAGTPEETSQETPQETPRGSSCHEVEHPEDLGGAHLGPGETFSGYSSTPPTSGPHDPVPTKAGVIYRDPQPVAQVIHAMEHGAVVFWVSERAPDRVRDGVQEVVSGIFGQGYRALIVTPFGGIEEPFAMTAWGTLQRCSAVDAAEIQAFVDAYYGSGLEGALACQGPAATLPACSEPD